MDYPAIQSHVYNRYRDQLPTDTSSRLWSFDTGDESSNGQSNGHSNVPDISPSNGGMEFASAFAPAAVLETETYTAVMTAMVANSLPWLERQTAINPNTMAALGWERYHTSLAESLALEKKEQIGSLGWDGPLAALSNKRVNIADYFKETVAVVTNPSIDRLRERAQFSTKTLIGVRPQLRPSPIPDDILLELDTPLLAGGYTDLGDLDTMRAIADQSGAMTIDDLIAYFEERAVIISMSAELDERIEDAIQRLQHEAINAVLNGAACLVLDDTDVFDGERLWIDPILVTAAIDYALRHSDTEPNLRRQTGIVVRSGSLRDLHDLTMTISLGANAILPYALYATALGIAPRAPKDAPTTEETTDRISNTIIALTQGIEKVTSTIGCHELRGFGHSFSSVGLGKRIAAIFGSPNYYGSTGRGLTWEAMQADSAERAAEFRGEKKNRLENPDRFFPKIWKKAEDVAHGLLSMEEFTEALMNQEQQNPVAIRHILGLKESDTPVDPSEVDISIKDHAMPVLISAMSFGSQGELSYKAYAEAAYLLNIICVNGEGGEMSEIMGKYPNNRGQQIASGRFGVGIEFLNSVNLLEIKIGQGAKPGEGGQLPGYKVTEQIAEVRHSVPGVGLISPSNNHDLYSIEDLAQLIDELKTANPYARVSVKIPVVPGVGIIAVGVAKAGADIITLTGYDGGTGAARAHSLRHVGLPAEIGLMLAHSALISSGIRDDVELWCDGGMKSGRDVVKMMCLGANRVGFGTLAMVAVGCTICRGCHDGTCHVGITTHVKTTEEAETKGFKSFRPFEEKGSAQGIVTMFNALGDDIRKWTAKLGFKNAQELVGRADLLEQIDFHDKIDLTRLLHPAPNAEKRQARPGGRRLTRPRNTLSKQITSIVEDYVSHGENELTYDDEQVMAMDRALGTHLAGAIKRDNRRLFHSVKAIHLSFSNSAVPGNGLGAFNDAPINVLAEGGAQDGVGKCATGGTITILKGLNHNGKRVDGSVGKSFAYGARGGFFIVQGDADTRACIRLSGADVVFGGEIDEPLNDELGGIGARANLKGYAFEYMTSGRALVLGDPGPWICAGMTGGVVYQRVQPEMGLTLDALRRRIAIGATVDLFQLDEQGIADVNELLTRYIQALEVNNQSEATGHLYDLLRRPQDYFVKICSPTHIN
jgi:glutamate synthase (NADPH/NADH) large chain